MHLLNVHSRKLERFEGTDIPFYAILSHTWGNDEITFQDVDSPGVEERAGYEKLRKACEMAAADGFNYIWIDVCCIDKRSSVELSEAINSMYRWYQEAALCYVYLCDLRPNLPDYPMTAEKLRGCRWFTRGWTLQELIAPSIVIFLDGTWHQLGTKWSLGDILTKITRIPGRILRGGDLGLTNVAQRMSWASGRKTTRLEDRAYSLMGIFGVNMPLLYGEGEKAFIRLQEEIIKVTGDCSIFAWVNVDRFAIVKALAPSPDPFECCDEFVSAILGDSSTDVIVVDNKGIHLQACVLKRKNPNKDVNWVVLPCKDGRGRYVAIGVRAVPNDRDYFERLNAPLRFLQTHELRGVGKIPVCIRQGHQIRTNYQSHLARAAANGNVKVVGLHLEQAAKPNISLYQSHSALEYAVMNGHEVLVDMLLSKGADVEFNGEAAIHHAIRAGHEGVARRLIQSLSHVDCRTSSNETPLIRAAEQGQIKLANLLIEAGANLEAKTIRGETALTRAVRKGEVKMVKFLAEQGANLEVQNVFDMTPLLLAIHMDREDMVRLLLEKGADSTAKERDGPCLLDIAKRSSNRVIAQLGYSRQEEMERKVGQRNE